MRSLFSCAKISGVTASVPTAALDLRTLDSLASQETLVRTIVSTGFSRVRVAPKHLSASDLCFNAAERLLKHLGVPPSSIDAIIFVSQTPDFILPPTSSCLQARLGVGKEALAFDINYGCSGFIYGLFQAYVLIAAQASERVLVLAGETPTRLIANQDYAVRMVFGDAGSAALVERGSEPSAFAIRTDGTGAGSLIIPAGGFRKREADSNRDANGRTDAHLRMDGASIMAFAMREIPGIIDGVLSERGWESDRVTLFAFHQANRLMLRCLCQKMNLDESRAPFLLSDYGNCGPASIPLLLCLCPSQIVKERTVLCGFGTGLSWGAVATSLAATEFLPVMEME